MTGWTMPCSRIDCARSSGRLAELAARIAWVRKELRWQPAVNPGLWPIGSAGFSISPISAARPRPSLRSGPSSLIANSRPKFPGSRGAQRAFMPDHFRRQLQVRLTARAMQIVEKHRLSECRCLGHPHIAGNDRRRHSRTYAPARLPRPGWRDCCARRTWSAQYHGSPGPGSRLADLLDGLEQLAQSFKREELALSGTRTESAAAMALIVSRLSDGGQSIRT